MENIQIFIIYYTGAFVLGLTSGISRTLGRDLHVSITHTISVGLCAGLLSVGLLLMLGYGPFDKPDKGLGISIILGLAGRELNDLIAVKLLNKFFDDKDIGDTKDGGKNNSN